MQIPPYDDVTEFLELFGGPIAMVSAIAFSTGVAYRWKEERHASTRKHMVPVLYWAPLFLMTCMVMHCLRNAYDSVTLISAGKATFQFYHYSLQLFGAVLFYQAYLLLQQCRKYVQGQTRFSFGLYRAMFLVFATTFPTWFFTPIGIVPSVVLIIMLPVSLLVHKSAFAVTLPVPPMQGELSAEAMLAETA
ncbi:hypothetical protein [Hymenobacter koreensis]|uniref:Uncharacterized protein n=1 Tax=Hymenobacter koreensis TaxID=1084523 RepID=A0ABP8J3Z4_9BACT